MILDLFGVFSVIKAISGDGDFIKGINNSLFTGFVHSAFNRTFNIKCLENGDLYTIACRKLDNGPNTLIIDVNNMKLLEIEVNEWVRVDNNLLNIGDKFTICVDKAYKWESVLPTYPFKVQILKRNLKKIREYINIYGVGGGIKKNF